MATKRIRIYKLIELDEELAKAEGVELKEEDYIQDMFIIDVDIVETDSIIEPIRVMARDPQLLWTVEE